MKSVTAVTVWNDAVGARMSIVYSEIDDSGKITSDNKRVDRVITDTDAKNIMKSMMDYAQSYVDSSEE